MRTIVDERYEEQICVNCKYHRRDSFDSGYVCTNPDSEYVSEWTLPDDFCDLFEEKDRWQR